MVPQRSLCNNAVAAHQHLSLRLLLQSLHTRTHTCIDLALSYLHAWLARIELQSAHQTGHAAWSARCKLSESCR